jgi:hypothetical protein
MPGSEQSPISILYQRNENASGSNASISEVNCKKGADENEIGITAISGATRKKSTVAQIAK